MKKFFCCLLILAVFSGFVFWTGWTQFKVQPDCVGIVVSKTGGVCKKPVVAGKFSWNWEFLLPTNAQLHILKIEPVNLSKTVENQLPGASWYSSSNYQKLFTYSFDFAVSLSVEPENVVKLYSENKITCSEDLSEYLSNAASALALLASSYYIKKYEDNPSYHPESVRREDLLRSIKSYEEYPEIEVLTFSLKNWQFPDFVLYKQMQSQLQNNNTQILNTQNESAESADFSGTGEENE